MIKWERNIHQGWIPEHEYRKMMGGTGFPQSIGKYHYTSEAGSIIRILELWSNEWYWEILMTGTDDPVRFHLLAEAKQYAEDNYKK